MTRALVGFNWASLEGNVCGHSVNPLLPGLILKWSPGTLAQSSLDRLIPCPISCCVMSIGRTILAFLVTVSLALVPIIGAFSMPSDQLTASEPVITSAHHCCDEDTPADHTMKDCQAAAGCFAKCFNFYAEEISGPMIQPANGGKESVFADQAVLSPAGNPPFRPPRS
jgi:hypothetical protein